MVFSIKDPLRLKKRMIEFIGKLTEPLLKTPKSMTMSFVVPRSQDKTVRYMPPRATDGRADSRTFHNSQSENARHQNELSVLAIHCYCFHHVSFTCLIFPMMPAARKKAFCCSVAGA